LTAVVAVAPGGCGNNGRRTQTPAQPSAGLTGHSPIPNRSAAPGTASPSLSATNPAAPGSTCPPADLRVTTTTDRATYRVGEPVTLSVTANNRSGSPCNVPTGPCLPQVVITDSHGAEVWNRAAIQVSCPYGKPYVLAPGTNVSQTITWDGTRCAGRDPNSCPGGPVLPGSYQAAANWNSTNYGLTKFVVAS